MKKQPTSTRHIFVSIGIAASLVAIGARGQSTSDFNPPDVNAQDSIGVDLVAGLPKFNTPTVSIGPGSASMTHAFNFDAVASAWGDHADNNYGVIYKSNPYSWCDTNIQCEEYTVRTPLGSDRFWLKNGVFVSTRGRGATLTQSGTAYTYVDARGIVFSADANIHYSDWCTVYPGVVCAAISSITEPTGKRTNYNYQVDPSSGHGQRLLSVSRNDGLAIIYSYDPAAADYYSWRSPVSIVAVNLATDYCDVVAGACNFSRSWPTATVTHSGNALGIYANVFPQLTITDWRGEVTRYTNALQYQNPRVVAVKASTSASADTSTYVYYNFVQCNNSACNVVRADLLKQATFGTGTWNYSYTWYQPPTNNSNGQSPENGNWATRSTNPDGEVSLASYNTVTSIVGTINIGNDGASFTLDNPNRLQGYYEDGKLYGFQYDSRGNLTVRKQSDTNGQRPDLLTSASFDVSCSNIVTCNSPNWVSDPKGNRTDYTYDATHGGVLTITSPATDAGIRPQIRRTYTQRYAWLKAAGGGYVQAAQPIWLLASEAFCRTGAANASGNGCSIPGDEVVTTFDYGPDQGPNNLWKRGQVTTSVDGGVTTSLRSCIGYDAVGNVISKTTPNAALTACP